MASFSRCIVNFAVANYQDERVYVTGGFQEAAKMADFFDIKSNKWHKAPSLNQGRRSHGCIGLGRRIYVFGGQKVSGSIESLLVGEGQRWQILKDSAQLKNRFNAAVTVFNGHSILVFGG